MANTLQMISKDYFKTMNAIAEKIAADIEKTEEAYQELWDALNEDDRKQAIDENIICPIAVIKYASFRPQISKNSSMDTYTWFTKSQLDLLNIVSMEKEIIKAAYQETFNQSSSPTYKEDTTPKVNNLSNMFFSKIKDKVTNFKISSTDETQNLIKSSNKPHIVTSQKPILKPKAPPPPPPSINDQVVTKLEEQLSLVNNQDTNEDIPKTGFDFLDNW